MVAVLMIIAIILIVAFFLLFINGTGHNKYDRDVSDREQEKAMRDIDSQVKNSDKREEST